MPTTFNVFSLGTGPEIDPNEGNSASENASLLVGLTFGSFDDPLYENIQTLAAVSVDASYNSNNNSQNETYSIDGGPAQTHDGYASYESTITYADGSTAEQIVKISQDTNGNIYLIPHLNGDGAQATLEAGPIQSVTFNSVSSGGANVTSDRSAGNYLDDTTATDDTVGADANDNEIATFGGNDTVEAFGGDDRIEAGSGDDVVYGDTEFTRASVTENLSWIAEGGDTTNVSSGFTQDTGIMSVNVDFEAFAGNTYIETSSDTQYVGSGPQATNSALNIYGSGGDNATTTLTFEAEDGSGMTDEVANVSFRINDVDTLAGQFVDTITVTAFDVDGNEVPVAMVADGDDIVTGQTATGAGVSTDDSDSQNGSVSVDIAGPVHTIVIEYINTEPSGNQQIWLTDVHYDTLPDLGGGNDSIDAGEGDDIVFAGGGDDTVFGGAGNDTLEGEAGSDTLDGGIGNDTLALGTADGEQDTVVFTAGDGADTVSEFELPIDNGDGTFTGQDLVDVTGMLTISGDQVTTADVSVVANVDGDAVLFFPNGESLTLVGITPAEVDDPAILFAMGIPQDGIVSGDETDNTIDATYTGDPDSDLIDNSDAILTGEAANDDIVMAGDGNDTILSGDGNDEIYADHEVTNLIVNGSFEDLTGTSPTSWGDQGTGSIVGWSDDTPGAEFDLHDNGKGNTYATDGTHVLDMGGTPNNLSVYQDVAGVVDGETYRLSLDAGDMSFAPNNSVEIYWNGILIDTIEPAGGTMEHFTYELIGGSGDGSNRLQFTEIGPADNNGLQLDNIQLIGASETGSGDDVIQAGDGDDLIVAGAGNDTITDGTGNDTVYAGGGDDTVTPSLGSDEIYGGEGNDTITPGGLSGAGDTMYGGDGNDTIGDGLGDDTSFGGAGDDVFDVGGFGTNTIEGGETGESVGDVLDVSSVVQDLTLDLSAVDATDNESGTLNGPDTTTFIEIEAVALGSGDDTVTGSSAADTVDTGAGADTIDAGEGDDVINIGDQDGDSDLIRFSDGDGSDTITGFDAPTDDGDGTFTGIDQLDVTGLTDLDGNPVNTHDVTVTDDGSGNAVLNFPNGESLTFIGLAPAFASQPQVLIAMGIPAPDGTVSGTSGNDLIDTNYLGDPDGDRVDSNDAILPGDTGNDDLIEAGAGNDTIIAGDGDDSIFAGSGDDTIFAGAGNDSIDMGSGSNVIYAGDGDDTVSGASSMADSTIYGGAGNDTLETPFGTSLDHEIYGGDGNDFIRDNGDANTEDLLDGGAGDDEIIGGEGNDTIIGGTGDDVVDGGAGDDTFILEDGFGEDTIAGSDFAETTGDVLDATAMTQDAILTFEEVEGDSGGDPGGPPGGPGGPPPGETSTIPTATLTQGANEATIQGVEQFNLGSGNDTVIDDGNNNSVHMGGGDDTFQIVDEFGDDTVVGGETGETTGDDLDGSGMTQDVTVTFTGSEEGTVTNPAGDTLTFSEIEQVETGSGDDTIYGGTGDERIITNAGDDDIDTGAGNDSVDAGAGNDEILGGAGADTVDGGADYDFMNYSASVAGVDIDLQDGSPESGGDAAGDVLSNIEQIDGSFFADDTIIGDDSGMLLKGWGGDDTLGGGAGNDTLEGGDDQDTFVASDNFGDDTIIGGQGGNNFDTLDLSNLSNPVTVTFTGPGAGTVTDLVTGDTIVFSEIEQLILTNQDDVVDASANNGYTYIQTLEGNDSVLGSAGNDIFDDESGVGTANDGAGNDTYFGGAGDDEFYLGNDDDTVFGGSGNDSIFGQEGDDTLYGDSGNDTIGGDDGDDRIMLEDGFGNDTITGGEGAETNGDTLDGSTLAQDVDIVMSGAEAGSITNGTDTAGFAQIETFITGSGDDSFDGDAGNDTVFAGAGNDTLDGSDGDDVLYGGDGNDTLIAGNNTGIGDQLFGGDGDDTLTDSFWNATLDGGNGQDTIYAGFGDATIFGGEGGVDNDTLNFTQDNDPVDITLSGNEAGTYADGNGGSDGGEFTGIENFVLSGDDDTFDGSLATTTGTNVEAGAGNDSATGTGGADTLDGGTGSDQLNGGGGDDTVLGGDDDDEITVESGEGTDTIEGGEGGFDDDELILTSTTDGVTVNLSSEESGTYAFDGGGNGTFSEIETLTTTDQADSITGSTGNDQVSTGAGADTIDGGVGNDTINVGDQDGDADILTFSDGDGDDTILGFDAPTDNGDGTFTGIDTFDVSGLTDGSGDPINTTDVTVTDDGSGNAVLNFPNGESVTLVGVSPTYAANPAVLVAMGIPSDGTVFGTSGDDTIDAAYVGDPDGDLVDNNDAILAGDTGNDDLIIAGAGNDTVLAGDGNDEVYGGTGEDEIDGGAGNDTLFGGEDADVFDVSESDGTDTIEGGEGGDDNDLLDLSGSANGVTVNLTAPETGTYAYGGSGDGAFSEIEAVATTVQADSISGSTGDDQIFAGGGADTVHGGAGNDTIDLGANDGATDTIVFSDGDGDEVLANFEAPIDNGDGTFIGRDQLDVSGLTDATGDPVNTDDVVVTDNGSGSALLTFPNGETITITGLSPSVADNKAVLFAMGIPSDGTVSGTTGDDLIDGTYLGDPDGDLVDNNDAILAGDTGNDDLIEAGAGNDSVLAGDGHDEVYGGDGNDTLDGGVGNDTLLGESGDDTFVVNAGFENETIIGGETGETGGDHLDGSALTDDVTVSNSGPEAGTLTAGSDTATFSEIEEISTGSGDDTVFGGTNNDRINANDGDDYVAGQAGDDTIYGGAGNDTLQGGPGGDTLFGEDGDDILRTGSGTPSSSDSIFGGDGNDRIQAYGNSDDATIFGGEETVDTSIDTLHLFDSTSDNQGVDVTFDGDESGTYQFDNNNNSGDGNGTFAEIEAIEVTANNDTVDATASSADLIIDGQAGDDTIMGGSGNNSIIGGTGDDVITDTGGTNEIDAGEGNDSVTGGSDVDTIFGGDGNDTIDGDAGNDTIYYGDGDNTVFGGDGDDLIDDSNGNQDSGNDEIFGGSGNDRIYTGDGNDTITGGEGADTLFGEGGDDAFAAANGDTVYGGNGDDYINIENLLETASDITVFGGTGVENDGDTLDFGSLFQPGTLNATDDGTGSFTGTAQLTDGSTVHFTDIENIICFTPGTMIATPKGARDISTLKVGDLVVTRDHGLQPIRWIQSRTVPAVGRLAPVRIRPGVVVGQDADLLVSPQHRMLFQGYRAELLFGESEVLVAAKHLIDDKFVTREESNTVTYIHMLFDQHEIVFAHGAATESFHPGVLGLDAIADEARDELFEIFPDLRTSVGGYGDTARRCLKSHEARLLSH